MDPVILTLKTGAPSAGLDPITPWAHASLRGPGAGQPTKQLRLAGRVFPKPGGAMATVPTWPTAPLPVDRLIDHMIDALWGEYVALLTSPSQDEVVILPEPTGLRDVFYTQSGDQLFVSSSIYGLQQISGVSLVPNEAHFVDAALALDRFGWGTPFRDVYRIPFGHALHINNTGQHRLARVWPRGFEDAYLTEDEAAEQLTTVLRSVVDQLHTDSSGLMLSGGRDSSMIAGLLPRAGVPCLHFHNPASAAENELEFATYVSDAVQAQLCVFDDQDLMELSKEAFVPEVDGDGLSRSPIDAEAKRRMGCIHFLDGKGGDSVFVDMPESGYVAQRSVSSLARDPHLGRNYVYLLDGKLLAPLRPRIYLRNIRWRFLTSFDKMRVMTPAARRLARRADNWQFFISECDFWVRNASLPKATYASVVLADLMYQTNRGNSRSWVSYPLLSQPVLEFMFGLDLRTIYHGENRTLQRRILRDLGLGKVADRTFKSGMTSLNMRTGRLHADLTRSRILDGHLVKSGLVDPAVIQQVLAEAQAGVPSFGQHALEKVEWFEVIYKLYGASTSASGSASATSAEMA